MDTNCTTFQHYLQWKMNLVLGYILLCKVLFVVSESLDGSKLSDQLKVIRDGVGVTHMQVQYIFYVKNYNVSGIFSYGFMVD
jgi:hypothetical protein